MISLQIKKGLQKLSYFLSLNSVLDNMLKMKLVMVANAVGRTLAMYCKNGPISLVLFWNIDLSLLY